MIRAQRLSVRRMRFTELSLLFWVAALAITGFVAVVAAETSSFGPAAIAVPVVFLVLMLALHLFLVARRFPHSQERPGRVGRLVKVLALIAIQRCQDLAFRI